jgi:hypothetical protein
MEAAPLIARPHRDFRFLFSLFLLFFLSGREEGLFLGTLAIGLET